MNGVVGTNAERVQIGKLRHALEASTDYRQHGEACGDQLVGCLQFSRALLHRDLSGSDLEYHGGGRLVDAFSLIRS